MASELIDAQVSSGGPTPQGIDSGTNMLLPQRSTQSRLAHFPEEIYDLSAESHLTRFMNALLGDSGAGQVRKRLLTSRLQQSLQGIHFYDLDKFYGGLFGVRRSPDEALTVNPYTGTATSAEWTNQQASDSSYRSRITQFARGLSFGPTPTGIELISEALLSVDCDVYETWSQADASYQTYGEIQALNPQTTTYTNLLTNPSAEATSGTVTVYTNLLTNPSCEATSGTVTVRTNLATDPTTAGSSTSGGSWGMSRWFGVGGSGTYSFVQNASDGPLPGVGSYEHKVWTVAGPAGDTGVEILSSASSVRFPVVAGQVLTISGWMRHTSVTSKIFNACIEWFDSAGSDLGRFTSTQQPNVNASDGWVHVSGTTTAPPGAASYTVILDVYSNATQHEVGSSVDATGLLVEETSVLLPYFDGTTQAVPDSDLTASWTGTANASTSVLTGVGVSGVGSTPGLCLAVSSAQWVSSGSKSVRIIASTNNNDSFAEIGPMSLAAADLATKTVTFLAKARLSSTLTGNVSGLFAQFRANVAIAGGTSANVPFTYETTATNAPGVYEVRATADIPAGTLGWNFLRIYNGASAGNGDVWWDDLALVEGNYTGPFFYGEELTRTNLLANPSAETTLTPWTPGNFGGVATIARVADSNPTGWAVQHTATAADSFIWVNSESGAGATSCVPGSAYTASVYVAQVSGGPRSLVAHIVWRNSSGGVVGEVLGTAVTTPALAASVRLSVDAIAPANAAIIQIQLRSSAGVSGDVFLWSRAMIEGSPDLHDYFEGTITYRPDPDLTPSWTGTPHASQSVLTGVGVDQYWPSFAATVSSSQWHGSGSRSLRIIAPSMGNDTASPIGGDSGAMRYGMATGGTYTVLATVHLSAAQTGTLSPLARSVVFIYNDGTGYQTIFAQAPNVAGDYPLRLTFTVPVGTTEAFIRLYNGASMGNGDVWWDDALLVEGTYLGPYFDGTTSLDPDLTPAWTGTANASTSTLTGFGTPYSFLEGMPYSQLQGASLGRLAGNERREFVVRPKRPITLAEGYELGKVLRQIKPADARFQIDSDGSTPYAQIPLRGLLADSNYWEVLSRVAPRAIAGSPYTVISDTPVEQPRPPFSGYQGEAWSYIGDIIGIAALKQPGPSPDSALPAAPERVMLSDGTYLDYPPRLALVPRRHLLAGRSGSDGVLVAHPYWASSPGNSPDLAPLFTDNIDLTALNKVLTQNPIDFFPQNPVQRFWATASRDQSDPTVEILEIGLTQARRINYVSVETAKFPHVLTIQAFINNAWVVVGTHAQTDSNPAYLPRGVVADGHPQHNHPGHWDRFSVRLSAFVTASSIRVTLQRAPGIAPVDDLGAPVAYSLALRSLDVGYRVYSLDDVPADALDGSTAIGATFDPVGSRMEFFLHQRKASDMLSSPSAVWRSDPQPINYSVVSLYLDTRSATGDSQILDTIYLDPIYSGSHLSIYTTEDLGDPVDIPWYEALSWRPVDRDYRLQKGYVHLPPTAARHVKLEFTALSVEQYPAMLPLTRTLRLFPQALIDRLATPGSNAGAVLPVGMSTAIDIGDDRRYADALQALRLDPTDTTQYLATESLYATNVDGSVRLRDSSWALGFTPWHQGESAPRFDRVGPHVYDTIEMQHTAQVAFFVGLRDIKIFRTDPGQDDDSMLYDEHFFDFRQIEPGMTWTFNPGYLDTVLSTGCVATSRVYSSKHTVWGVQFASQQTDPVQVVPDDDMRDPALATINWYNNPDGWHAVGDATVVYSPQNHSARMVRYSQPNMRALPHTPGPVQRPVHEVFSERDVVVADTVQTSASFGGVESPLVGVSSTGDVYAAVRLTVLSTLTSPLLLQVVDGTTGLPTLTREITANQGEIVEKYFAFPLTGSASVKVRVIQDGISNDMWEVDRLSLFDPGILWEWSVNGGETWVAALGVRNDAHGVVTFPAAGNQLAWRVTGMRPRMSVSALRIRPLYLGVQNARFDGVQRGPNVSPYDAGVAIEDDPMFTTWSGPIPREWFLAYRQYPTLVSAQGPTVTEFSRFYGRPVDETVAAPVDVVTSVLSLRRTSGDLAWVTVGDVGTSPAYDTGVRVVSLLRGGSEPVSTPADFATLLILSPSGWGPVNVVVHPV